MKRFNFIQSSARYASLLTLIAIACIASVRAQVIPHVCVETTYQTGTVTLASNAAAGAKTISVNGYVPPLVSLVINPGSATEEIVPYVNVRIDGSDPYTLGMTTDDFHYALNPASFGGGGGKALAYAHSAGETVRFSGYSGTANFGYNNTGSSAVTIPKGVLTRNYFAPGPIAYSQQITTFQPGIHDNAFSLSFGGKASDTLTWFLDGGLTIAGNGATGRCATITYQGRLSNAGAPANGNYDLQFTAYNAQTGGAARSDTVTAGNVAVANGVFTAQINFGSTFINNFDARYLEIGVRPAGSTGAFTLLAPRQPITDVPFAVNAQTATNVSGGFVQLPLTTNTPHPSECAVASQYGRLKADAANNRLYICTSTGWKSTVLQ
jgi:hypothetical protein